MFTPGIEVIEVEAKAGGLFYVTPNSRREIWLLYMDRMSTGNNPCPCGQYETRDEAIDALRVLRQPGRVTPNVSHIKLPTSYLG